MQINNETLRAFRSALMDTVKPLEEKYGVKIEMGNITYSSDSFHFKVNAQNTSSILSPKEQFETFVPVLSYLGITYEMFEQVFEGLDHKQYILVALKPSARKNCCIVKRIENGKQYICPPDFLGIKPEIA